MDPLYDILKDHDWPEKYQPAELEYWDDVADKPEVCSECLEEIPPGNEYTFSTFVMRNGEGFNHNMCKHCESVENTFFASGFYGGRLWSIFIDYLRYNPTPSKRSLMMLTHKARARLMKIIRQLNGKE